VGWSRFVTKSIEGWRARGQSGAGGMGGGDRWSGREGSRRVNGPAQEEGGSRGDGSVGAGALGRRGGGCTR